MADLLRSGHTMLNIACPICGNPIFRNRDKENFCPICNRKVLIVENDYTKNNEGSEKIKLSSSLNQIKKPPNYQKVMNSVKEAILEKIDWITQKLKVENQFELIETHAKVLLRLCDLLEKLFSFDNSEK